MNKTSVVIVEPGARVNSDSEYYCENFLRRGFLLFIQAICGRHNWTLAYVRTELYLTQKYDQLSS